MEVNATQQMLSRLRQVQEDLQRQVNAVAVEASAGGGMVTVKMNGQKQIVDIRIEPDVFAGKDQEMLQDLIRAAVNEASRRVDEELANQMKNLAGGIPGMRRHPRNRRDENPRVVLADQRIPASRPFHFLLHVLPVVNFVLDAERLLRLAILPILLGDYAVGLGEALGGERMRTKITGQTLNGQLGELLVRVLRVDDVFVVQLGETLKRIDGAVAPSNRARKVPRPQTLPRMHRNKNGWSAKDDRENPQKNPSSASGRRAH